MSLPPGFLDEIRERVSIAKVIERKVSWDNKKSNPAKGDYWACCPFHQEKTSSFHVEDRKGFYYCFGCHAKGDAITFLKDAENLQFMEAVEVLAAEAGMPMPERDPRAQERQDKRLALSEVMEQAVQFYRLQYRAAKGQDARDYIDRRGLSAETQDRFEIGYAPDARTALTEHLTGKGVEVAQLAEAGLAIIPDEGGRPFDRFRGRIMFPIRDARGRCIAFGGRAMDPNARAKYLNSPETVLFDKGRSLFNHGPAREAAGRAGALIVAEGYMDVIALAQGGFAHAVAPLGTAITEDQLRLMWRIADEPVIALDGDKAGLRAAMRVIDIALPLIEPGKSLRFALMPEGQDPDDLIKASGPTAMRTLLDKALPMVELLWRRETEGGEFDSPERRAALDARLRIALAKIGDPGLRNHYGIAIKERRATLFAPVVKATLWQKHDPKGRRARLPAAPSPELKASGLARAAQMSEGRDAEARWRESGLLFTFLCHPRLAERYFDEVETLEFVCRDLDQVRDALISAVIDSDGVEIDSVELQDRVEHLIGEPPLEKVSHNPLAGGSWGESHVSTEVRAVEAIEDMLSRHRALISAARQIAEAEAEISATLGEGIDHRLTSIAHFLHHEAGLHIKDVQDEEEEELSRKLHDAIKNEIWKRDSSGRRR